MLVLALLLHLHSGNMGFPGRDRKCHSVLLPIQQFFGQHRHDHLQPSCMATNHCGWTWVEVVIYATPFSLIFFYNSHAWSSITFSQKKVFYRMKWRLGEQRCERLRLFRSSKKTKSPKSQPNESINNLGRYLYTHIDNQWERLPRNTMVVLL